MDFYLNDENVYKRLEEEYRKYKSLIIAYDYDDTVFDFHSLGRKYDDVINLIRRWRNHSELIVFTGCSEEKYTGIKNYLYSNDVPFDSINGDSKIKTNSRKIYYNALLDDRAGLSVTYNALLKLIKKIERGDFNE